MDFIVNVVGQIYIDDSNILQSILNKIAFPNYLFSDNLINSILFIYLTIKVFLSNFFSIHRITNQETAISKGQVKSQIICVIMIEFISLK